MPIKNNEEDKIKRYEMFKKLDVDDDKCLTLTELYNGLCIEYNI